jgi:septal ring factor EnvC (AmiA/AmiB activator)
MENELLTFEVRFLKAQLAEPERIMAELEETRGQLEELKETRAQLEESRAQLEESRAQLEARLTEAESSRADLKARLEGVEGDLLALLRGLLTSPFGRILRLKRNFRALEQRYLGTDA